MKKTLLKDVATLLEDLGISKGDHVLIHADLRIFGRLEGGGHGLVDVFRHRVGEEGLLVTPSFTFTFPDAFHLQKTSSSIGALTTLFSREKSVERVPDGMTSYYLIGNSASEFIEQWDHSSYGEGSIVGQLNRSGGKILQLGTDILSLVHYVEQTVGVPYRKLQRFSGVVHTESESFASFTDFYARTSDVKKMIPDPIREAYFSQCDTQLSFNSRPCRLFNVAAFVDFAAPRLAANRMALIEE
ncbi:MAG: hypothetical protein CMD99_07200 [Gammaproteobacteria bacterium]|nr:hypothetical protein [Gammaproteobacteria bacterium]|tara:strand:- start:573 stop:1301 length:729 start_codon:yes stop_codon:yes gene_type:complete